MKFIKVFKKDKNLVKRVYAVEGGFLIGHFITMIDYNEIEKKYDVLACKLDETEPKALQIDEKDIKEGIEKGVLTFIETLTRQIYRECKKEYKILKTLNILKEKNNEKI